MFRPVRSEIMLARLKRSVERSYDVRFLYWLFGLNFIDLAAKYLPGTRRKNGKKRVIFVRLDGIGDYVLWAHTLDSLDEVYPKKNWERILIGNKLWEDIARQEPFFDKCVFLDPRRAMSDPVYRFKSFRKIRSYGADTIVNPRLTREFILMDSIVRVSGARERIGSHGIANRMTALQTKISSRWYSRLAEPPSRGDHEIESNFRFLNELRSQSAAAVSLRKLPATKFQSRTEDEYAVLFPGAQQGDKMWPVEKFAEAAKQISDRYKFRIAICGGPGDRGLVERFGDAFGREFNDLVGKLPLSEMCGLIGKASVLLTNDTGAGHIGIAEGCPTVVITPGNHVGRFFPYPDHLGVRQISVLHEMPCFGCDWHCVHTEIPPGLPKPCVADVSVGSVVAAVDRLLTVGNDRLPVRFEKTLTSPRAVNTIAETER